MSNHASLDAASNDRKARLAQLKSLKRKQSRSAEGADEIANDVTLKDSLKRKQPSSPNNVGEERDEISNDSLKVVERRSRSPSPPATSAYLSGRNYDPETRGPKLGFEAAPIEGQTTLESQAKAIADSTRRQADDEEKADKPLDLFKLQPKKPTWDLKRDLERKLEILNVRTDNAIARMVRERISKARAEAKANGRDTGGDEEVLGMDGATLVEAMHQRERENEEDERREREDEDL